MARYLAPDLLKEMNIQTFNGFMGAFGKTFTTIEMTPMGVGIVSGRDLNTRIFLNL